ncbi:hypothetical protein BGZ96_003586, partial [Linnemannia gamsii]
MVVALAQSVPAPISAAALIISYQDKASRAASPMEASHRNEGDALIRRGDEFVKV